MQQKTRRSDAVGGGQEGNGKGQGSFRGPGPAGRPAMHQGSPILPTHHEGGGAGRACARYHPSRVRMEK